MDKRAFIFSFDAKGIVRYRGNGIWQFEYEKDMTPRKINNHTWLFSNTEADGNFIDEEFITLTLPKEIKNAHLSKNEFDDPVLEYYLKPSIHFIFFEPKFLLENARILQTYHTNVKSKGKRD